MAKKKVSAKSTATLKKVISKAKAYHKAGTCKSWQACLKKAGKEVRKD